MKTVKPKKSLGQHFLTDENIAKRIASSVSDFSAYPLVEVGPGMGVLTKYLLDEHKDFKVVEIDTESIEWLKKNMPALDPARIIAEDFLRLDLNDLFPGEKICVIGNYPYNISSQIFFHVLDYREKVECCAGMLQKEVAERLAAPPGTKARGILSVLLQAWYNVEYLFTVDEDVFEPVPKVKSGVVRMVRNGVTDLGCDEKAFKNIIKTTFSQRRKTLRNSVKPLVGADWKLDGEVERLMSLRPEQLSVEQFIMLTNSIKNKDY